MKLFELRAAGPTAGDCTTPQYVDFYSECTVREFINEVLKKGEWGSVIIGSYFDGPRIEYKHDKIVSGIFSQDILDSKIKNATAHAWEMRNVLGRTRKAGRINMADMCYECQFSDNGYFCRFMEHGVCTATSCKRMVEIEERIALDICNLLNGTKSSKKGELRNGHNLRTGEIE